MTVNPAVDVTEAAIYPAHVAVLILGFAALALIVLTAF